MKLNLVKKVVRQIVLMDSKLVKIIVKNGTVTKISHSPVFFYLKKEGMSIPLRCQQGVFLRFR